jgi:hypothetical protein
MLQFHLSGPARIAVRNLLIIGVGLLSGPYGHRLLMALLTFPLPQELSPLFRFLSGLSISMPLVWLALVVGLPLLTIHALRLLGLQRYCPYLLAIFGVWAVTIAGFFTLLSPNGLRTMGLMRVTERAKPLIAAIENYR